MNSKIIALLLSLTVSIPALADFGEIDIIVKESIEAHFRVRQNPVDLNTHKYNGPPKIEKSVMTVSSSVSASEWYDCLTKIEIVSRGVYLDLGSECVSKVE